MIELMNRNDKVAISMDSSTITITNSKHEVILRLEATGNYDIKKDYMLKIYNALNK